MGREYFLLIIELAVQRIAETLDPLAGLTLARYVTEVPVANAKRPWCVETLRTHTPRAS